MGIITWCYKDMYRGSNMSGHVLLHLLNRLRKIDKMRGLSSILSIFRNKFNKLNYTRALMFDSIYHMSLRLLWNLIPGVKSYKCVIMYGSLLWTSYCFSYICKPLVVHQLYCMALFHSQTQRHTIKFNKFTRFNHFNTWCYITPWNNVIYDKQLFILQYLTLSILVMRT